MHVFVIIELYSAGFFRTLLRVATSAPCMLVFVGQVFRQIGIQGYLTYLPKYIQEQFRQTETAASLLVGNSELLNYLLIMGSLPSVYRILIWRFLKYYIPIDLRILRSIFHFDIMVLRGLCF